MALLVDEPRSATIRADTDGEVLRLERQQFVELLGRDAGAAKAVATTLARRLRRRDGALTDEAEAVVAIPIRAPKPERHRVTKTAGLIVAVAVCVLLAVGVIVGAASVHDLSRHGGSLPGAAFIGAILALLALGMYRRRYWAVLGFEALLAFQIIVTSLALVVASTITAAGLCTVGIGLGGWLFWKLIRVMGRIQAGEPGRR